VESRQEGAGERGWGWNRIGEKSATRREGCEDASPTMTLYSHGLKTRSYLPYFTPSRFSPRDAAQSPEH